MHTGTLNRHRRGNLLQTLLLLGSVAAVLGLVAWGLFGTIGVWFALGLVLLLFLVSPAVSPALVLRMYRATPLRREQAQPVFEIVETLARRAGLPATPKLYLLPTQVMNAFAVGSPGSSAIAFSVALAQRLDRSEFAGVMAHEITHIQNRDVRLMSLADLAARLVASLSRLGLFLLLLNLPLFLLGGAHLPWFSVAMLVLAPGAVSLAQLALSRTREFDADAGAVELLGDARPLATALDKIEQHSQSLLAKLLGRRRGMIEPSLLRTHPHTTDRIARLQEMQRGTADPSWHGPQALFVPRPPDPAAPRIHRTGVWF
ncbi:MAG: zinc metalloprotease HtpX [Planctomycetota bacterium]